MKENFIINLDFLRRIKEIYLVLFDLYLYKRYKKFRVNFEANKPKKALILGSGPSLSTFNLNNISLSDFDIYVVNAFSKTDIYTSIKPQNYCILDPLYFELQDERVLKGEVDVINTWDSIFSKTSWELTIYVALNDISRLDFIIKSFPKNNYIKFVNLFPLRFRSINKFAFYSKGVGFLGGNTVVQLALQISLLKKTPKTYLIGVDHNWFEQFKYDDISNDIYLLNTHFYGESRINYPSGELSDYYDLSGEFSSLHNSFEQFKELYLFSKYLNLDLFRSSKSFLHFIPYYKID